MSTSDKYNIAPYSRANLQALITRLSHGEISDQEFHEGMEDIIVSWKAQFAQPECPWGWRYETLRDDTASSKQHLKAAGALKSLE